MTKQEYYNELHEELAIKLSAFSLLSYDIMVIRSALIGFQMTPASLAANINYKLPRLSHGKRLERNLRILVFLAKASEKDLKTITCSYEYPVQLP